MLHLDTCVLLALLTPEVHSQTTAAFLEQATQTLAISPWSATELHAARADRRAAGPGGPVDQHKALMDKVADDREVLLVRRCQGGDVAMVAADHPGASLR